MVQSDTYKTYLPLLQLNYFRGPQQPFERHRRILMHLHIKLYVLEPHNPQLPIAPIPNLTDFLCFIKKKKGVRS